MSRIEEVIDQPTEGLPPGLRWPRAAQTAAWAVRPYYVMRYGRRRFGDVFSVRLYGFGDMMVVGDPAVMKEIFTGDREVFAAGRANTAIAPIVGRRSPIVQDGEPHLKQRRLLNPPFQGQAVLSYRERIQETAEAEVRKWPRGTPIAIRPRMEAITVETILHAVIGVSDPQRVERVRELLREMSAFRIPDMWAAWIFPKILDSPIGRRNPVMRARAEMVRLIKEEIAATRANPNGRNDILALLAATRDEDGALFDEEQVVDQVISLIFAGHDTTTTTLAWACERLVRHPAALARLHESLDAGEEDYLDAVVKETLRVRPTLYAVWRKLTAPAVVAGHRLPADTLVYGALPLVHSSAAFPDPDEFRPERFLDGQPPPYSWIPFGGGPHRCMGAAFALMETKAVLTTVLRNVELRPPPNQRPEGRRVNNVTLRPARGGRVVVTARSVRSARSSAREPVGAAEAPTPECPVHADASTTTRAEQPA